MDDFAIQYQGFSPSQFAQTYVREIVTKVHEEAPSSSHMKVTISKVGDQSFRGLCRISSRAGSFFAIASGSKLTDVANQLLDRMRRQLDKWKTKRFDHQSVQESRRGSHESDTRVS